MNEKKIVEWLANNADEIQKEVEAGEYTIPGDAYVPNNTDIAFVKGMEYAYRNILGYVAAGDFDN